MSSRSYSFITHRKCLVSGLIWPRYTCAGLLTFGLGSDRKVQIGLVGYPNVGKSSTINALIGAKKVSVSATPGKTKHFQTIHLSQHVILCDCPGLVFPNFATTKADLVCNGILPIDQMREYTGPSALVAERIPKPFLEAIYGISIKTQPRDDGGTGIPTAEELLKAYARARGFQTTGVGQPDEARASRLILKDYVNGKLLYVAPPPTGIDGHEFNRQLYDIAHLPENRRRGMSTSLGENTSLADDTAGVAPASDFVSISQESAKSKAMNKDFFKEKKSKGHISLPFHQHQLTGRKAKAMAALEKELDPKGAAAVASSSKKHFKGNPRGGKKKNRIMHNTDD
jgi:large subunit GTPase 1